MISSRWIAVSLGKEERDVLKSFERVTKSFSSSAQLMCFPHNSSNLNHDERCHNLPVSTFLSKTLSSSSVTKPELHVIDDLLQGSESLNKIINSFAYVLRLGGLRNLSINKSHHSMSVKERCNSNPISALEHDDALKILDSAI